MPDHGRPADPTLAELGHHFDLLARQLRLDDEPTPRPERVIEVAREALSAPHAGLTLIASRGRPSTVAATGPVVRAVDDLQYELRVGPCLEAASGHDVVRSDDLASEERWGAFGRACVQRTAVRSMLSVRLALTGGVRAAMNFFGDGPGSFGAHHEPVAALFAPFAALALHDSLETQRSANLERALSSSRTIGTAIGIVMARELLTEEQAFQRLVQASQALNVKLRDVAERVKETGSVPQSGRARS